MGLLQKGGKKVFVIGEFHTDNFCRELGFVPIAEVVEDFLLGGDKVDFMIETDSNTWYDVHDHDHVRQLARSYTNVATLADLGSRHMQPKPTNVNPVYILELTRSVVFPYIKNDHKYTKLPNARVHWLEPVVGYHSDHDLRSGESLQYWFHLYLKAKYEKNGYMDLVLVEAVDEKVLAENQKQIDHCFDEINKVVQTSERPVPAFTRPPKGGKNKRLHYGNAFTAATREEKLAFLDVCIDKLLGSTFFKNCKRQTRFFDHVVYRDAFWASWEGTTTKTIEDFYYYVQRFFMDVYTCCRIMKQEEVWFNKIVIYAGGFHVKNYISLLQAAGFTYQPITDVDFNPFCSGGRPDFDYNFDGNGYDDYEN